jgi:hypothetical protein
MIGSGVILMCLRRRQGTASPYTGTFVCSLAMACGRSGNVLENEKYEIKFLNIRKK